MTREMMKKEKKRNRRMMLGMKWCHSRAKAWKVLSQVPTAMRLHHPFRGVIPLRAVDLGKTAKQRAVAARSRPRVTNLRLEVEARVDQIAIR